MSVQFFLDGTQLSSLADTYNTLGHSIDKMAMYRDRQKQMIPDKQIEVENLQRKVRASEKIYELKERISHLSNEMAWAFVRDKEKVRQNLQVHN